MSALNPFATATFASAAPNYWHVKHLHVLLTLGITLIE
jgi:hypothetical protein